MASSFNFKIKDKSKKIKAFCLNSMEVFALQVMQVGQVM
jgi:hypothetical protein